MNNWYFGKFASLKIWQMVVGMGCVQIVLVGGCHKEEIHAYRVPREVNRSAPTLPKAPVPGQGEESYASEESDVAWTVPDTWHRIETTADMRIATFHTGSELEAAVTAFPGDVGGLVANVNRWRGQVGLESTDEQGVEEHIQRIEGVDVIVVDIQGTDQRLLGTVIDVGDGQTWFVKVIGASDMVEKIKDDLITFSTSFHIHRREGGAPADQVHAGASGTGGTQASSSNWEPPAQWSVDPDMSPILMAAYFAQGGARITLTSLTGEGGGMLSNINRWRGQVGLAQVGTLEEQPSKDLGLGAMLVDLVSSDGTSRIVAGIVPLGEQSLYFKLTGSESQVEEELERFEAFINGVAIEGRVNP